MNNNYELLFEKDVADLKSKALLLKHKKTGARVFVMENDDDNKVFYIGFRTPPEDSTGVAHIIEHTVLCGSDKYPLKDPFIELAKGSLNTFLNAMTYPDKTVYPVASRNDKDFQNLMSVYMDAVFHPNIYKHQEIFKQEGWNYLLEDADAPIQYNGVVYNEMKGAFSSPESVLDRKILNSLFPDTCYGVESGGDPDNIPDLTYENYLDFHRKYYHPSNSYIYLYGDMDVEERLTWMDEAYLSHYDHLDIDSSVKLQPPFEAMKRVTGTYPISEEESEKENTYLAYNLVCGTNLDPKKYIAMQMLIYALVGTQGAPVRQRLIDEGIGKDILPSYDNGILEPYFSIVAKNADSEQAEDFLRIINEEFEKAASGQLNKKSLTAQLNIMKFKYKEADFGGYPKGLIYGLMCLDSWLYDDQLPLLHLDAGKTYEELEELIDTDYYENLIRENLLQNLHSSLLILTPEKGLMSKKEAELEKKLADFKASLTKEQIDQMVEDSKALAAFQEEESSKEELETIPLLKRSDIKRDMEGFSNIERSVCGMPLIWHDYFTNGIAYLEFYFNANHMTKEELPYLALLKPIMSFVDTENYSYSDLNNEINTFSGGLILGASVSGDRYDPKKYKLFEFLSVRTLYENLDKSMDLVEEVLFKGKYSDTKRLQEIIAEQKSQMQMTLNSAGHQAAAGRAESYFSESGVLKEQLDGITYYKFIEDLEKHFKERKEELQEKLVAVIHKLLVGSDITISYTGDEAGLQITERRLAGFKAALEEYQKNIPAQETKPGAYYDFAGSGLKVEQKNEAFKTSGGVNYVARAGKYLQDADAYSGVMAVFRTIMNYDYLWFNIRVQGGAYGCMSKATSNGKCYFVTYRDPNVARSNEVFEGIPEYLENFDIDEREMTKFVIGTMSGVDSPLTPAAKGLRDFGVWLQDISYDDMNRARHEIIDVTPEDIRKLAPLIRTALAENNLCVIGNETKIEEDRHLFKEVWNLFE